MLTLKKTDTPTNTCGAQKYTNLEEKKSVGTYNRG